MASSLLVNRLRAQYGWVQCRRMEANMKTHRQIAFWALVIAAAVVAPACTTQNVSNSNSAPTAAVASPSPTAPATAQASAAVTLPVLNALFGDEAFKTELKSKLDYRMIKLSGYRRALATSSPGCDKPMRRSKPVMPPKLASEPLKPSATQWASKKPRHL